MNPETRAKSIQGTLTVFLFIFLPGVVRSSGFESESAYFAAWVVAGLISFWIPPRRRFSFIIWLAIVLASGAILVWWHIWRRN